MTTQSFCQKAFSNLEVQPDGNVQLCCFCESTSSLGNSREESLQSIWEGDQLQKIREDMLKGRPISGCAPCYQEEKKGLTSPRQVFNQHYAKEEEITPKLIHLGITFSNICNLSCRTCRPYYSTAWYQDAMALQKNDFQGPLKAFESFEHFKTQIAPYFDNLQSIFLAGGEPFIQEEHYKLLNYLIEKKRTDICLEYSSNLSTLKYSGKDLIPLLKKFKTVILTASIDAIEQRFDYLRKGANWNEVEKNIKIIQKECPNIKLRLNITLSRFNALHLPELLEYFIDKKLVQAKDISIVSLTHPSFYSIERIPIELAERCKLAYQEFHKKIGQAHPLSKRLEELSTILGKNPSPIDDKFFESLTHRLDDLRDESISKVFPELSS